MNASDDPDRNRQPQLSAPRPRLRARPSTSWTRKARRAHMAHALEFSPAALNAQAKRAARACLEYLQQNTSALDDLVARIIVVEIAFICDAEILELNASYRGKNAPTDVLSFSQIEGGVFPSAGEEIALGDVVISIETAARQACELRHALDYEIAFLMIHGVLHLCGYDHDTSARRRAMWELQDAIIETLAPREGAEG